MATEAEGSVRAMPDAPDADVVMAAHGFPDTVICLLVCICTMPGSCETVLGGCSRILRPSDRRVVMVDRCLSFVRACLRNLSS
jgi:hypothetical protein